ncbi:MAG: 3-oxoadipate enol-lactonase [Thermodesulfobacteriota bacterium]
MEIRANGIRIHYELSGKKGAPWVILSHSLASSLRMWELQMEALEPYFQVLRYDIRGHGRSEVTEGAYSFDLLSKDAVGLLDALGIEKVNWVGLSMGGMIGQSIALNDPGRLHSLVLCDTMAIFPEESLPVWQERMDSVKARGMQAQLEATLERWFTPSFLRLNPPILDVIRNEFLATPVKGYLGCIEAICKLNFLDRLPEIKMPTLIMVGEEDPGTPISASEAMHQRIPNSKLTIIPSARHLSNVEQPEVFNTNLMKFLKSV